MGDVVQFGGKTNHDLDPDVVLESLKGTLHGFVLAGYSKDETEERFSSTYGNRAEVLWLIERLKLVWLTMDDEDD